MADLNAARTALARTHRPRHFSEMATQEHVSETLRMAVQRGRTAHAYLFCGPRGVGKTTAARVLAMALNCPNRVSGPEAEGTPAAGEPCGVCESCEKIWAGKTSLDVVEIDAASNRGVDDARDLRERAMYAPTDEHRYKVYIIDEAHMLTREAWNALLKILEEPPPRVIFIFATTEPQKIQQTAAPILSRCQRFDFRRITTQGIVDRLQSVLADEGVQADADALMPIARRAEGGMRDALSLTDQVLSFAGGRITPEDVRRVLGLVGEELYLDLFHTIADRRYADIFHFVQRVLDDGYDLAEFYKGLSDALRALMVSKFDGPDAADVRDDLRAEYGGVAQRFGQGDLLRMLSMVAELDTEGKFRKSANPRTMLEALLLRWAFLEQTVDIESLLRAAGGQGPAPLAARADAGAPARTPATAAPGRSSARSILQDLAPPAARETPERQQATSRPHTPTRDEPAPRAEPGQRAEPTRRAEPPQRAEQAPRPEPTSRAEPTSRTSAPSIGTGNPVRDAELALRSMIDERLAPHGLGIFLKTARIVDSTTFDTVLLELPAGSPGLERLSPLGTDRAAVQGIFADMLGRSIELQVRAGDRDARGSAAQAPQRITPAAVKTEKLATLSRDDAGLEAAVRDWDLELLD